MLETLPIALSFYQETLTITLLSSFYELNISEPLSDNWSPLESSMEVQMLHTTKGEHSTGPVSKEAWCLWQVEQWPSKMSAL